MSIAPVQRRSQPAAGSTAQQGFSSLWLCCLALLAAGILMRSVHLGNIAGINGDEAWSGIQAVKLADGQPIAWRTPTGNPVNVFFLFPLAALHAVLSPSFLLLRLIPWVSALAAIGLNYWLCRKVYDGRTAVISSLFLALLPINIAYSRFVWDASQSVLVTVLVMYLALWQRRKTAAPGTSAAAMLAMAAAIIVHPTNVLVLALLIVPAVDWPRRRTLQVVGYSLAGAAAILAVYLATQGPSAGNRGPEAMAQFASNYLRLFSGTTVYCYISGAVPLEKLAIGESAVAQLCDLLFAAVALAGLIGMIGRLERGKNPLDQRLVVAWFSMLAGFFLVAGPRAIMPHFERYGMCLVAPGALLLARGLTFWLAGEPRYARWAAIIMATMAWFWPTSFYINYLRHFERTGGTSHDAFRTAAVEPKLAAYQWLVDGQKPGQRLTVVCDSWWTYWPIAYLASRNCDIELRSWVEWERSDRSVCNDASRETCFVGFSGDYREVLATVALEQQGIPTEKHIIRDYNRQELIWILKPTEKVSRNY